jgi:peptidoglycan L-alanyl-D-glutamate endopeptidase CwlK
MKKAGSRTIGNLRGIDPRMILVIGMALSRGNVDFTVIKGVREEAEQVELYKQGRTKPGIIVTYKDGINKKSRHQLADDGLGKAIDYIPYPFDGNWESKENKIKFIEIGKELKFCADFLGFNNTYGGIDWKNFVDLPHFQLNN